MMNSCIQYCAAPQHISITADHEHIKKTFFSHQCQSIMASSRCAEAHSDKMLSSNVMLISHTQSFDIDWCFTNVIKLALISHIN